MNSKPQNIDKSIKIRGGSDKSVTSFMKKYKHIKLTHATKLPIARILNPSIVNAVIIILLN